MKCRVCSAHAPILMTVWRAEVSPHEDGRENIDVCRCSRCGLVQTDTGGGNLTDTSELSPSRAAYMAEQEAKWGRLDFLSRHTLEHQTEPMHLLGQLHGRGVIEVPNIRAMMPHEFFGDHTLYFEADTLRGTLERAGFIVERIEEVWHGTTLSAVVRRPIHVVWGAGHQAFAVARLWCLSPAYHVDSAPHKQGVIRNGYEVSAPERLLTEPPDVLYVITSGYNDEVCAQARALGYMGRMVRFDDGRFSEA